MQPKSLVVYELKGTSLDAVHALRSLQEMTDQDIARQYSGDSAAYQFEMDLYKDILGQKSAATAMEMVEGCAPRAYAHYPAVYSHPDDPQRAYMIAPTDFKGRHFAPLDGVMLKPSEGAAIVGMLTPADKPHAAAVMPVKKPHGMPVPMDFDADSMLQNFVRQEAPFEADKVATLKKVMNNIRKYLADEKVIAGASLPEEFTLDCFVTYEPDGRPGLIASAERRKDQARLAMKANCYFTPESLPRVLGFHKIIPNKKYAGGLALQSFLDAMATLTPDKAWQACNERDVANGITPPKTPAEYLRDTSGPWPFPKSSVAP